jgi:membrane protein YqaA with SNARE-associated domain
MLSPAAYLVAAIQWGKLLRQLGGLGLVLLGILGPVIPLPGSLDALTIVLAARHRELWLYYAAMASLGAILGGQLTYELARRGGTQTWQRRLPPETAARVFRQFGRWAFGSVFISGLIPPPIPAFPVLLAAGAMRYSRKKFLASLIAGRAVRYFAIALLAATFGRRIFSPLAQSRTLLLVVCLGIAALMTFVFLWLRRYLTYRPDKAT